MTDVPFLFSMQSSDVLMEIFTLYMKVVESNFEINPEHVLRSFYLKVFHKAITFNDFIFKIIRKDSPNCDFCEKNVRICYSWGSPFFFFFFFLVNVKI